MFKKMNKKDDNNDQQDEQNDNNGRDDVILEELVEDDGEQAPIGQVVDNDEAEQTAASSEVQGEQEMTQMEQDFEALQAQSADLQSQLKRALADYQNLERRVSEGRDEVAHWATGGLVAKLLPVLDHLEKAVEGVSEEERKSGWFRGVELAVKQFKDVLKGEGLEEIVAEGEFDPVHHEAVDIRDGEDNTILEVAEKGYNLNGKVLRPARVVVGRKS
jgi:molecular chaperone GrpE